MLLFGSKMIFEVFTLMGHFCHVTFRGQKFHSSASNYECNLERMSNSSQSTRPVGVEVILHITPICTVLHMLLKDKCMCLQDE